MYRYFWNEQHMNNLIDQLTALPALYLVLVALQVADVATTLRVFALGGYEKNKPLKKLMDAIGVLPALLLKIVFVAVISYPIKDSTQTLALLVAFYVFVIFNNARVALKLKNGGAA